MSEINYEKAVLVTGGTGYVASWIVRMLLEDSRTVRTTVRDKSHPVKNKHLLKLQEDYPGKLELYEADLLKEGSFLEAMQGCELVIHTASPFVISGIKDPQKELVEPALEGTRNVLNSVNKTDTVKRVVLTSSVVSIYGESSDIKSTENGIFTENYWNKNSSLSKNPYSYSKTLAEKEAWKISEAQDRWDLLVINPGFVMGPSLTDRNDSTSIDFMLSMGNGKFKSGAAGLNFGIVDVRDVARAHIEAGFRPSAKGRHILVAKCLWMIDIANILRKKFGNKYPFPRMAVPKFLMYLIGPFMGFGWSYINENIDIALNFDNSYSKADLGINYRPVEDTITEHFEQLVRDGLLPA